MREGFHRGNARDQRQEVFRALSGVQEVNNQVDIGMVGSRKGEDVGRNDISVLLSDFAEVKG